MKEPKYLVGDRVLYNKNIYIINGCNWSWEVETFVYGLSSNKEEIGGVAEKNLNLVAHPTKSTLKPMDIVKLRDERICVVAPNKDSESGLSLFHPHAGGAKGCVAHLERYDEDLTHKNLTMYDIIAIYQPINGEQFICMSNYFKNVFPKQEEWTWRRYAIVKEISIKEAEKMLKEELQAKGESIDDIRIVI